MTARRLAPTPLALVVVAALAALAAPVPAGAQEDANVQRGFAPEKIYDFSGLDSVNLFNGNLVLTLPIGNGYPVNGALSHGLTLFYNSKVWDFTNRSTPQGGVARVEPARSANAGMGWRLSLGELYAPGQPFNDTGRWLYVGEDGGQHLFYTTLHFGETVVTDVYYTRDGSYLRLRKVSGTVFDVDFPEGTVRRFNRAAASVANPFTLTQIRDPFNNSITVTQTAGQWTIADPQRTLTVNFVNNSAYQVVSTVVLAAFNGTTATYSFGYTATWVRESCQDVDPDTPPLRTVPLLTSIALPAGGGSFLMNAAGDYNTTCTPGAPLADLPGTLARLKLPTGGRLEWTYQDYTYPSRGLFTPGEPPLELTKSLGVATKQMLQSDNTCLNLDNVGCQWSYQAVAAGQQRKTIVTYPTGDETVHHFSQATGVSTATWMGWEYGLPINIASSSGTGFFLSQEIYDGPSWGSGKKRSVYMGYEHDKLPGNNTDPQDWYNTNRRVIRQKTVYHDDGRFADAVSSEFDGLGHHRRTVTGGDFDSGNVRTEFTDFNPARGTYTVNQSTNTVSGGFTPPPVADAWILGTSTESWAQEGSSTVKTQTCFAKADGSLRWQRTFKNGSSPGANDLLAVYTQDTAGNRTREQIYGAAAGGLPATAPNDACTLSGLPADGHRADHTYSYGALATSQLRTAGGVALSFKSVELVIDRNTGLASKSTDPAGVVTDFEYDGLGRLTWVKPAAGHGAWTESKYVSATQVDVNQRANGSKTGTLLAQSGANLDPFGRPWRNRRKIPGVGWTNADVTRNTMGWKHTVSERMTGTPQKATKNLDYDPFGRVKTIRPPDSTGATGYLHDVKLSYGGVRTVTREVRVGTSYNPGTGTIGETLAITTEVYDRQGRLWKVREPGVGGAPATETVYGYDAGGRLTSVAMGPQGGATVQTRTFSYDGRGFLEWENHPEKSANVRGLGHDVDYESHDVLGNPGRRVDGASDLAFSYDRAGRLSQVAEWGSGGRVLKSFVYATSSPAGNWKNGKIETATRYNYVINGGSPVTAQITESYTYGGKAGRMSQRDLLAYIGGSPAESFTQSWVYSDLGQVSSAAYPKCNPTASHPFLACTAAAATPRTVTYGYTEGSLTAVSGFTGTVAGQAAGIGVTYHPNGMVHQVAHGNGVTDAHGLDPDSMRRPASISAAVGATQRWSTGTYAYDGAGNVAKMGTAWFTYDELSRVKTGTVFTGATGGGSQKQQTYSYDPYGNMTDIAGNPDPGRATPTTAATNRLTSGSYDAAGNLVGYNGASYDYDAFQMMWRMTSGTGPGTESWLYLYLQRRRRAGVVVSGLRRGQPAARPLDPGPVVQSRVSCGKWKHAAFLPQSYPGGCAHLHAHFLFARNLAHGSGVVGD